MMNATWTAINAQTVASAGTVYSDAAGFYPSQASNSWAEIPFGTDFSFAAYAASATGTASIDLYVDIGNTADAVAYNSSDTTLYKRLHLGVVNEDGKTFRFTPADLANPELSYSIPKMRIVAVGTTSPANPADSILTVIVNWREREC